MPRRRRRHRKLISLLVPMGGDDPCRTRNWAWLQRYWECHLPGVEIVIGRDRSSTRSWRNTSPEPFSKATAVNDAFSRSHGDILVILDTDAYLSANVIEHVAHVLRVNRERGIRDWYVPYTHLYRLTRPITERILASDPCHHPATLSSPPHPGDIDGTEGSGPLNTYGAMCTVLPREAFEIVGGMDPRFRGWGAEDFAFALALDVLWGPMQHTPNDILHLWHPAFTATHNGAAPLWQVKMWANQTKPGINNELGARYQHAAGLV